MSAAERIMSQWEVAVSTPPNHKECRDAWSELVCLSKRYKSIVKGMERRQTAERQRKALIVSSGPSFASMGGMGGMGGTGGISSLKAVIECLKGCLNAVVGSFWDIVAAHGRLEAATQGVV